MKKLCRSLGLSLFLFLIGCNSGDESNGGNTNSTTPPPIPAVVFNVTNTLPHDTSHFIEGLEFHNGFLLESTGNYNRSRLVKYEFPGLEKVQDISLGGQYFGEGVTVFRDTVYQLTYREGKVLMYDFKTLKPIGERPFQGEGWGLTHDSSTLIATSGGSHNLYFYEPGTFKLLRVQGVYHNGAPVVDLNELEYVDGYIYANQWQYPYIFKIDPKTGAVVGKLDLTPISDDIRNRNPKADVLNGIAYNKETGKMYVTGKYWPTMYELEIK